MLITMKRGALSLVALLVFVVTLAATETRAEEPPSAGPLRVAFVVSEGFTLIDFAGPWEVFNFARIPVPGSDRPNGPPLFDLYTVSASTSPVEMGLAHTRLTPDYTFQNAPKPDIIVVGAQGGKEIPGFYDWLKKENAAGITVLSICIGAGELAEAGLLNGKQATTHHGFIEAFRKGYPKTTWQAGKRYVRSSDTILTAGGLTSGIDLALHVVAQRFGENVAQKTAEWMEYTSDGWKQKE